MAPSEVRDINPQVYYDAGARVVRLAGDVHDVFMTAQTVLRGCDSMAGSDDSAKTWATSYDERSTELWFIANHFVQALHNYGTIITQAGHIRAMADHNHTPDTPIVPVGPVDTCWVPPPSAGGPGEGLIENMYGIVGKMGTSVPDGDTDKLSHAADAWHTLATDARIVNAPTELLKISGLFIEVTAPENEHFDEDLRELKTVIEDIEHAAGELADACLDRREALDTLRRELSHLLSDLAAALLVQATITIATAWITAGLSAVAGGTTATATVARFAAWMREATLGWKATRSTAVVKETRDLNRQRGILERLRNLRREPAREPPKPAEKPAPHPKVENSEFEYNTRPERLNHTFAVKHKLEGVVERSGGREQAARLMLESLRKNGLTPGAFEKVVEVSGENVSVRGYYDGETIKIGTAFIP